MWYVIQTKTGQEEELILFFDHMVSSGLHRRCFVPKGEWLKRLGGAWQLKITPLFPGYVFVETEYPKELFLELKAVPKLTKLLSDGEYEFTPLRPEEEIFLRLIMGEAGDYVVRLSTVEVAEDGTTAIVDGLLKLFEEHILKMNLRKRYALVNVKMLGEDRTVIFGVKLPKDEQIVEDARE